ncbi:MAG: NADH-quinone oxidoreductase subunit B, partial [Zymomonas sp.]
MRAAAVEAGSRSSALQVPPAQDRFLTDINDELADKGFLVTSTDDLIQWARTGSLMWM